MIFSIKPQIFELKCVFSYFRLKTHITLLLPVYVHSWEQRKLGEVLKERTERAKGDEELLSVTIANGVIRQIDSEKRNTASEDRSNYKIVKKGDVPYNSMRMWQGAVGNSKYNGIVSPAYTILTPTSEANGKFFMELFKKKSTLQIFQRWSQGLTSDTWNLKYPILSSIQFAIPSVEEQEKIAEYFSSLDHLITLHQCKCQIDGCRFQSPLAITWEQRKLGEIGSVSMCRRIFKEQTSENGEIPFYKIGTFGGEADAFISRELFEEYKAKYQYPKKGDILISASGSIGRTVVFTGKNEYFQDSNIVWLNHDKHLDNSFLKCFYSIVKWAGIEGSTIKRLYNDNILNTAITLPSVEEQQKIGAYFENLDNLITLHQCE